MNLLLKEQLESIFLQLNKKEFLGSDPLEYVHFYQDPWDQEAMALLASQLAYGNAKLIRNALFKITKILRENHLTPALLTRSLNTKKGTQKALHIFEGFYYRFHKGHDVISLLKLLLHSWTRYGSLAAHFNFNYIIHKNLEVSLKNVLDEWKKKSPQPSRNFLHFLSSPQEKSACKRWCLFLKWMIRKDEIDPGTWHHSQLLPKSSPLLIRASDLIIPVDTHILKMSQKLKLTHQKTASWKAALEITEKLKEFDPLDPIKYDFSITRIGIMKLKNSDYLHL